RHTRWPRDWSSDVCSSDLHARAVYADLLVSCEVMDRWYTDRHDPQYTTETGRLFRPDVIIPVADFCDRPITKLMFLGHPEVITRSEERRVGKERRARGAEE